MPKPSRYFAALALAAFALAAVPLFAQDTPAAPPAAPAAPPDLKAPYLRNWDDVTGKLVALAEAVPAEKYAWRPAEGVRSVSEVYMHVAGANFFLPSGLGAELPPGLSREMEKETDKAKVVAALKDSIAHARKAAEGADPATLGQEVELFGRKMTRADVLLVLLSHAHEHLGQAIAYARSNGVVPPWSRAEP
ncbi:MAG TPA: DinB family protein [Thermoanaerobaculia bacterium]